MKYKKVTIYTAIIAIITLLSMIPGGPVENRSFSNVYPVAALALNIFIGLTLILAILSIYFMYKNQKWAYQAVGIVGLSYILIFALDLGKIFPVSLDEMSLLMKILEIFGLILGILLLFLSYKSIKVSHKDKWSPNFITFNKYTYMILALIIIIFIIGVYFATKNALL